MSPEVSFQSFPSNIDFCSMPVLESKPRPHKTRPTLGHVNLMVDTFIANTNIDDLRAIVRNLLASNTPGVAPAFTEAARSRLRQTGSKGLPSSVTLFTTRPSDGVTVPTPQLNEILTRARSLYGAGMGFTSLGVLASVVRATIGLRWEDDSEMADGLAIVDADIGQAIQSSKEELAGGYIGDFNKAREAVDHLRKVVSDSLQDVEAWGGEFPFERASSSLKFWRI